jgi:hypothetical protein
MVTITRADGNKIYLPYVSGEGLCSDSSHVLVAGLGRSSATSVRIKYIDGKVVERKGVFRNEHLKL